MLARLPAVLAHLVLKNFDAASLGNLDAVCKSWNALVRDPELWRYLWLQRWAWQPESPQINFRALIIQTHRSRPESFGGMGLPISKCGVLESSATSLLLEDFALLVEIRLDGKPVVVEAARCRHGSFRACGSDTAGMAFGISLERSQPLDMQHPAGVLSNPVHPRAFYESSALGERLTANLVVVHGPSGRAARLGGEGVPAGAHSSGAVIEFEGGWNAPSHSPCAMFRFDTRASMLPRRMIRELSEHDWCERTYEDDELPPTRERLCGFLAMLWVGIQGDLPTEDCPQPAWTFDRFGLEIQPSLRACSCYSNSASILTSEDLPFHQLDEFALCFLVEAISTYNDREVQLYSSWAHEDDDEGDESDEEEEDVDVEEDAGEEVQVE